MNVESKLSKIMSNFSNQITGSQFLKTRKSFSYGTNANGNGCFLSDKDGVGYVTKEALDILEENGKEAFTKNLLTFAVVETDEGTKIPSLFKSPESSLNTLW